MELNSIFSPDSKFMQIMTRFTDLILLNLYFLICSIPIFTIGASATAMYTVIFRFDTDREGLVGTTKAFFIAFGQNFKQATLLWLPILLFLVATSVCAFFFYYINSALRYLFVLFVIMLVLLVFTASYAFPLLSQFDNKNMVMVKNAAIMSLAYLPRTILIAALNAFPVILLVFQLAFFLQTAFIWLIIYFAAAAYFNTLLLRKVFKPYMAEDEENEETKEETNE